MMVPRHAVCSTATRSFLLIFGWLVMSLAGASPSYAEPLAVASIKPVHALLAAVMAGVDEPVLIVDGAASPHTYSLKPSQARVLQSADLIAWVGPQVETFLQRPIATLGAQSSVLALAEVPGLEQLPLREGGVFDDQDDHDDHEAVSGAAIDGHLWLDPLNAKVMAQAMAEALVALDPENAATYRANTTALGTRLDALRAEISAYMAPVRSQPYIVLHDAYQYFEKRFRLKAAGAITETPEQMPGAARVTEMRAMARDAGAICVFSEPQIEPDLVAVVTEGAAVRTAAIDPLGSSIEAGPELYFTLMRSLAEAVRACLSTDY